MTDDVTTRSDAPDESYSTYLKSWQHSADAKRETHAQLDSYLLKFSAGALALSLSPAAGVFEATVPAARCLLVISWLLYLVTIGATMLSFRESAKTCDKMAEIAYRSIVERDESAVEGQRAASKATRMLNSVAIYSFLAALFLSLVYLALTFLARA